MAVDDPARAKAIQIWPEHLPPAHNPALRKMLKELGNVAKFARLDWDHSTGEITGYKDDGEPFGESDFRPGTPSRIIFSQLGDYCDQKELLSFTLWLNEKGDESMTTPLVEEDRLWKAQPPIDIKDFDFRAPLPDMEELHLNGARPPNGAVVALMTQHGLYRGIVMTTYGRPNGFWIASVKPVERHDWLTEKAEWQLTCWNVRWRQEFPAIAQLAVPTRIEEKKAPKSIPATPPPLPVTDNAISNTAPDLEVSVSEVTNESEVETSSTDGATEPVKKTRGPRKEKATPTVSNPGAVISDYIQANPGVGKSAVLAATQVTEEQWTVEIKDLIEKNQVHRTGMKKGTKYHYGAAPAGTTDAGAEA